MTQEELMAIWREAVQDHRCPRCNEKAGDYCRTKFGRLLSERGHAPHKERIRLAEMARAS